MATKMDEKFDGSDEEVVGDASEPCPSEALSKRAKKRLLKKQQWEDRLKEKRVKERQKKKERRKQQKESGESLGPSRKRLKRNRMCDSSCRVQVIVDCGFDDMMNDRDINNLVKQLGHCYAANRRVENPLQFSITSLNDKTKKRLDEIGDYVNWDVTMEEEHYSKLFSMDQIVYLSSESDNVLDTLQDDKVYVIGGLVDHNHHRGFCHFKAKEAGIAHARLPISENLELNSRSVLTINQVFEILVAFTELRTWSEAFNKAIPKRKVVTANPSSNCPASVTDDKKQAVDSCDQASNSETGSSPENQGKTDDGSLKQEISGCDDHLKQENSTNYVTLPVEKEETQSTITSSLTCAHNSSSVLVNSSDVSKS